VRDCTWVPGCFENIGPQDFNCSSDRTADLGEKYNCIAWAVGRTDVFWWPLDLAGYHWPKGLPKEPLNQETLENFIKAFETEGFAVCQDGKCENGYEKIAVYANSSGNPKHAARLLSTGLWTSKLGDYEDIEHPILESLEGRAYGTVRVFLKRPIHNAEDQAS